MKYNVIIVILMTVYDLSKEDILSQEPVVFIDLNDIAGVNGVDFKVMIRKQSIFNPNEKIDQEVEHSEFQNDNAIELINEIIFNCKIYNYAYIIYNGQQIDEGDLVLNFFAKNDLTLG